MKRRDLERGVARYVVPEFPSLRNLGVTLGDVREGYLLRGLAFDPSGSAPGIFRVRVFGQMLSVPADGERYVLFRRLGDFDAAGGEAEAYAAAAAAGRDEGRRYLSRLDGCKGLVRNFRSVVPRTPDDPLAREMLAHCHALCGDLETADRELRWIADRIDLGTAWERRLADRAGELRRAVASGEDAALAQLRAWREVTLDAMPQLRQLAAGPRSARDGGS
jgi:hypothetical protein